MPTRACLILAALWIALASRNVLSAEELTLENVTTPEANRADEPLAETFSLDAATRFLDQASLDWTKNRKCFTCHTNFSYLLARPALGSAPKAHQQVRRALETMVEQRWPDKGPRWDAEVVMSAAALAFNDSATTGKLHATTKTALDRMWTLQRDDGGFDWLKCDWPPMESDDHFGATMAAIAAGAAPNEYSQTDAAQAGLAKIRQYCKDNPPPTLHHVAMLMWAGSYVDGLITDEDRRKAIDSLLALQKDDGGWALATMGQWERSDDKPQDVENSDGYATGFVIYVLRRGGLPANHASLQKGVAWLKANQRQSGRWFTRSLNKDSKHFISHAGTAFALLALEACEEIGGAE